jgi:hypothetical protein
MAFRRNATWTVVAWNDSRTNATFGVTLPGAPTAVPRAVATSSTDQLSPTTRPARTGAGTWVVNLASRSIVTYIFG